MLPNMLFTFWCGFNLSAIFVWNILPVIDNLKHSINMGVACSSCSDISQAENAQKQRQTLLPETQHDPNSDVEGQPTNTTTNGGNTSDGVPPTRPSSTDLSAFNSLFGELAKFMKSLPPKSKKHIWEHAVTEKDKKDKTRKVFDKASTQEQITRLLCDCVIVYVKYLNRKERPLKTQTVFPYVQPAAEWIFIKYGELERYRFEQENKYFAEMLEEYQYFVK